MWTSKLHRTKDGASVTVPKDVLRQWEPAGCAYVRAVWLHGRLLLIPYTRDLEPCFPNAGPEEAPLRGHAERQS